MSSGKVHALATVAAAGIATPALALLAGQPVTTAAAFAAGCLAGLVVTPDLDVRYRDTHAETVVRRSGGCVAGALWNLLWLPYAYLIPRHRHWSSHAPVIGTALRLVYLALILALFWWGLGALLRGILTLPDLPRLALTPATWWALGGLALADALHWGMDRVL
jgi:uncharacterized metal-binding protein